MWSRKMLLAEADNAYQDLHNNSSDHAKASSNNIANCEIFFHFLQLLVILTNH